EEAMKKERMKVEEKYVWAIVSGVRRKCMNEKELSICRVLFESFLDLEDVALLKDPLGHRSSCMVEEKYVWAIVSGVRRKYNPKNTVGVFTLCEDRHHMLLPPTNDLGKIRTYKRRIEGLKPGGLMDLQDGLDMATMGFMCGDHEKMKKRFVVFAGGMVVSYNERRLQELGNSLKMNNIALDFVMVGSHINATRLKAFVAAVNNNDNSHLHYVASAPSICQAILSPHLFPHFEEEVRRVAARGSVSMEMLRAEQKKNAATYCDENVEPQEMNKKDNQSAKPEKYARKQFLIMSREMKTISPYEFFMCLKWDITFVVFYEIDGMRELTVLTIVLEGRI
ncbi:26S proteasome non-ATPase regulatory subunit 4, partial [Tanacetum coccineum]